MQIRRKEEAADHASADMARKVAALDQKDRSAAEKEQSLSSLTAELWAKASVPLCKPIVLQVHLSHCMHTSVQLHPLDKGPVCKCIILHMYHSTLHVCKCTILQVCLSASVPACKCCLSSCTAKGQAVGFPVLASCLASYQTGLLC